VRLSRPGRPRRRRGTMASSRATGRDPLSSERVLQAAMAFADLHGIDSLSMRKLAKELGYEVMSLYNHVSDKDAILDGLVDLVAAEIEPVATEVEWRSAMRASVTSARRALLQHPWAVGLWWERRAGPARLAYMES